MNKLVLYLLILIAVAFSCQDENERFEQYQKNFEVENQLRFGQIQHGYIMNIPRKERLFREHQFLKNTRRKLRSIEFGLLSENNQRAYQKIQNVVEQKSRRLIIYRTDPSIYNIGGELKRLLSKEDLHLAGKMDSINLVLFNSSSYYAEARNNIYRPLPAKARLGSEKQLLTLEFIQGPLLDSIAKAPTGLLLKKELMKNLEKCRLATKDYLAYCVSLWFEHQDSLQRTNSEIFD